MLSARTSLCQPSRELRDVTGRYFRDRLGSRPVNWWTKDVPAANGCDRGGQLAGTTEASEVAIRPGSPFGHFCRIRPIAQRGDFYR